MNPTDPIIDARGPPPQTDGVEAAGPGDPSRERLRVVVASQRGVVRLPDGTAHSLDGGDFPIPVIGKIGTTSSFRDALFVGSTSGPQGITVAVRIGFDDNRELGWHPDC